MTNGLQINLDALFGGGLGWKNIGAARKDVSNETNIDGATWSRIKAGKEGFGPEAAKKAAKIAGVEPVNLYVGSQVRSAKMRREAGEIDDATTARIVGKILGGLKEFPGATVGDEETKALQDLAGEASKSGATPSNQLDRLGRDGSGRKVQKSTRTATKSRANGTYGALGRNADGTSRRKVM